MREAVPWTDAWKPLPAGSTATRAPALPKPLLFPASVIVSCSPSTDAGCDRGLLAATDDLRDPHVGAADDKLLLVQNGAGTAADLIDRCREPRAVRQERLLDGDLSGAVLAGAAAGHGLRHTFAVISPSKANPLSVSQFMRHARPPISPSTAMVNLSKKVLAPSMAKFDTLVAPLSKAV